MHNIKEKHFTLKKDFNSLMTYSKVLFLYRKTKQQQQQQKTNKEILVKILNAYKHIL